MTRDRAVAAAFLALGAALSASSFALPRGVGGLPGPGFFPRLIGAAMLLLSLLLLWRQRSGAPATADEGTPDPLPADGLRVVLAAVGLLAVYLLLWGTGLFALRTAAFALLLLRLLGQPWRAALAVSVVLSATVALAFQLGFGVTLE